MEFLFNLFKGLALVAGCLFFMTVIYAFISVFIDKVKNKKEKEEINSFLNEVFDEAIKELKKED